MITEARKDLLTFSQLVDPTYIVNRHHEVIARRLERVPQQLQNNEKVRIMITVPPRHGKSRQATQLFPAWLLGLMPTIPVITTSYSADLAEKFGQLTKDIIISPQYKHIFPNIKLRKDSKSKGDWKITKGGSYTAVGVGGPITGKGAKCAIIDDVLKNREEAESKSHRQKIREWYTSTLYTRLEGYGAVIVIMTRWHDDDLAGWLLEEDKLKKEQGEEGENWELFNFPAIADTDEYIDGKLFRKEGEALWPSKYSLPNLLSIKNTVGVYDWSSLYQQNPILAETQEFKESMFRYFTDDDIKVKNLKYYTVVDPAISQKNTSDNTVVLTIAKDLQGPNWYRIREDAGHYTPTQTVDLIFKHQKEYQSEVHLETVAYQKALKYSIEERQREDQVYFTVGEIKSTRNKEVRIRGLLPLYERGVIYHRRTDTAYETEALTFPKGRRDDRLDCMAMGIEVVDNTNYRSANRTKKPHWVGYGRRVS